MPCSTEGALMRRHVGGAGCGARFPGRRNQDLGSSRTTARAVARRGCPLRAGRGRAEGRRQCCPDRGEVMLVRPRPEERSRAERRHCGAPGGARACHTARGTFQGAIATKRRTALRSLFGGRKENEGGAPRLTFPGLMNHACINADVMRESAGCLTCESDDQGRAGQHGLPSPPGEGGLASARSGGEMHRRSMVLACGDISPPGAFGAATAWFYCPVLILVHSRLVNRVVRWSRAVTT